ncbi:hypothetical protein DAPPUDRAFT_309339 [Daphnia pulex]|uniref:Uncharacterized protein n=1 Tax=Daphnia pulex TaxID=6669 RepID=E9HCA0_DAPPU|nr:hypothetical protein DAPPUDRAFT_309339 [Daphnia pulex]|eukprot:EFX70587.1 hypothetical protein DAPPUDRAFT_309339 [Daphnia pulex]
MKKTQTKTNECKFFFCSFHILFLFFSLRLLVTLFYIFKKFFFLLLEFHFSRASFKLLKWRKKNEQIFIKKFSKSKKKEKKRSKDYPIADCSFTHPPVHFDNMRVVGIILCCHAIIVIHSATNKKKRGSTKTLNHLQAMHIRIYVYPLTQSSPKNFGIDTKKGKSNKSNKIES